MFSQEYETPKPKRPPTIAQFVKKTKEPKTKPLDVIELVWLPDKFDNVTLQTGKYRVILSDEHPLYQAVQDFLAEDRNVELAIGIRITDWKEGKFTLEEAKSRGMWKSIGKNGFRFQFD